MNDYKAIVEDKETKTKKIIYKGANSLDSFKKMIRGSYPNLKIIKASINKSPHLFYYCNSCQKEILVAEKDSHTC